MKLEVMGGGGNMAGMSVMVNVRGGVGAAMLVMGLIFWVEMGSRWGGWNCGTRMSILSTDGWIHVARRMANSRYGGGLMVLCCRWLIAGWDVREKAQGEPNT